jgi:uncharacterized protein GlcG (DUF336 family)
MSIELQDAKRLLEEAEAEAARRGINVSAAVVDAHGDLLAVWRMEGSLVFTPHVAYGKAKASAVLRVPSDAYVEAAESPAFVFINELNHSDLVFMAGGLPIVRDGSVIGALGVSGGLPEEDAEIAAAALASPSGD